MTHCFYLQNSWYGGKGKAETEPSDTAKAKDTEGGTDGTEKDESSKESTEGSTSADSVTAPPEDTAGSASGIAKSTSAFFSNLGELSSYYIFNYYILCHYDSN